MYIKKKFIIVKESKNQLYNSKEEKGMKLKGFPEERGYPIDTCNSAQDRYKELLEYFSGE